MFKNKYLIAALIIVVILQLMAVYAPFMNELLHTEPLLLIDWAIIISVGLIIVVAEEVRKFIMRRTNV